jgi:NADH:ubiquinone oxidoreductase subunit 6 (subunit J)
MAGKRTKIRKKIKLNKKLVCTIGVLLLIIAVISAIIMIFKPVNVGKINKEGKAEYIERVANVTNSNRILKTKRYIIKREL